MVIKLICNERTKYKDYKSIVSHKCYEGLSSGLKYGIKSINLHLSALKWLEEDIKSLVSMRFISDMPQWGFHRLDLKPLGSDTC